MFQSNRFKSHFKAKWSPENQYFWNHEKLTFSLNSSNDGCLPSCPEATNTIRASSLQSHQIDWNVKNVSLKSDICWATDSNRSRNFSFKFWISSSRSSSFYKTLLHYHNYRTFSTLIITLSTRHSGIGNEWTTHLNIINYTIPIFNLKWEQASKEAIMSSALCAL